MEVIPSINETSFVQVRRRFDQAKDFGCKWLHLDVSDGKFTPHVSWNSPEDLKIKFLRPKANLEAHLMVENPDEVVDDWIDVGIKRLIVHLEKVQDLDMIKTKCELFGVELFLAINPDTPVERLFGYEGNASGFLILAVNPGLAGQKFKENQLEKIKALRQKFPSAKIEVDGGVNLETASRIKEAGADILVSASYIWNSENPKENYEKLMTV